MAVGGEQRRALRLLAGSPHLGKDRRAAYCMRLTIGGFQVPSRMA
jgi:hypothetical protein